MKQRFVHASAPGCQNRMGIDQMVSFDHPRPEVAIAGWCVLDGLTAAEEVWAVAAGRRIPCLSGLPQPDVAARLKSPGLDRSGFLCRVPAPVPGSIGSIRLIARHNGTDRDIGDVQIEWAPATVNAESAQDDYATWLRVWEPRLFWSAAEVEQRLGTLTVAPTISVILPTYDTALYYLERCIDSVTGQTYPRWELCIADDGSSDPRVVSYLRARATAEPRIRLSFAERNAGISAASNRALESVTGEFVVLLDHDDELHPSALIEVVRCLNANPATDLMYSDEDKIDQLGRRSFPAFKPEFDEDLLCGFDYLGHLVSMRTSVVKQVGGFRSDADGAQDWDLLLRIAAVVDHHRIRHIAKPLYHWRMHEDSTAFSLHAKPYAVRVWNSVVERHMDAAACCRIEDGLFLGSMRVVRRLPPDTRVSIVYRACDGPHQRRALNRSRVPAHTTFFELLLSTLRPADQPDAPPLLTVEELDSDVTVVVNCRIDSVNHYMIEELVSQALRDECGVVGGTIVDGRGSVVTAGLVCLEDGTYVNPFEGLPLSEPGYMGQARVVRAVASIGPQVFAFRTSRLATDLRGLASLSEDSLSDVCDAVVRSTHRQGLKVLHTPYAVITQRSSVEPYHPRQGEIAPPALRLNPNLEQFSSVRHILKAGIA
jgi:hypothetical protein